MGKPRLEFAGAFYHVTNRGNARETIFQDDYDYAAFLRELSKVVPRYGWLVHGFCLIPNHYHLLVETPEPNLGRGMLRLNGAYARGHNVRHERVGHVFQGPYDAKLVETDEHLLEVCRYIARNPCRAGLCDDPADWPWSSYRPLVGLERAPPYLHTRRVLGLFGTQKEFRSFVSAAAET
jgi:putative transposase